MNAAGIERAKTPSSNQILQKLLDTAREAVMVVDANMRVTQVQVTEARQVLAVRQGAHRQAVD